MSFRKFKVLAGLHRDRGRGEGAFTDGKIRHFKRGQITASTVDLTAAYPEKFEEVAGDAPVSYVKPEEPKIPKRGQTDDEAPAAVAPPPVSTPTPTPEVEEAEGETPAFEGRDVTAKFDGAEAAGVSIYKHDDKTYTVVKEGQPTKCQNAASVRAFVAAQTPVKKKKSA